MNTSYTYNDNGIRTSKTSNGVTTEYFLDGTDVIRQSDGTTTLDFFYDGSGILTGFEYQGNIYYYVKNLQNDIVAITDVNGTVIAEYTYSPFGEVLSITGSNTTIGNLNPFRYRSYYYDTDTSLYYLQSRYYDPEIGRFLNSDDVNYIGATESELSYNPFAYCENDPVNGVDYEGSFAWSTIAKMLLGVLAQYAGDIINNIISGRTGIYVFKPTSSLSTYISAALSAIWGGNKLLNSIGRSIISTATQYFCARLSGNKQSLKKVLTTFLKTLVIDYVCSIISKVAVNKIHSLSPKSYSSFANSRFVKGKNLSVNQIKSRMQKLIRANIMTANVFNFFINSIGCAI